MQLPKRLLITTLLLPWAPYWFPIRQISLEESPRVLKNSTNNVPRPHWRRSFHGTSPPLDEPTSPSTIISDGADDSSPSIAFMVEANPKQHHDGTAMVSSVSKAPQWSSSTTANGHSHHGMLRGIHNASQSSNVYRNLATVQTQFIHSTTITMTLTISRPSSSRNDVYHSDSTLHEPLSHEEHQVRQDEEHQVRQDQDEVHRRHLQGIDWDQKHFGAKLKNWVFAGVCVALILATCCNVVTLCCCCCACFVTRRYASSSHPKGGAADNEDTSTIETIVSDSCTQTTTSKVAVDTVDSMEASRTQDNL